MNNTKIENETKTRDNRKEMKKARRHRALRNVMLVAVHALGVGAIVGLGVALYFSQDKIEMQAKYQNQMESVYAKAYYNLLDGVNDVDTTMAKL